MYLIECAHVDDQTAIDLRLAKRGVSLPASSHLDPVPPAKTNHYADVVDGPGSQDCDGGLTHDISDVVGSCRQRRRIHDQLAIQLRNAVKRVAVVRGTHPRSRFRVETKNGDGAQSSQ